MEKIRADLSRAPKWATHYVHSPRSDSWWFVNIHTKEWTVFRDYVNKYIPRGFTEEDMPESEGYFWLELVVDLENK